MLVWQAWMARFLISLYPFSAFTMFLVTRWQKGEVRQRLYILIQLKSAMVVGIYTIALRSGFI